MALPFFAITLFVSAFLLFLVQPMIGKMILPKLGGTPQVWNTCMVFFQTALLAGYAYTHTVSTRLTVRRQIFVHCAVLVLPLFVLFLWPYGPFNVADPVDKDGQAIVSADGKIERGWVPNPTAPPIPQTLLLLSMMVGLPFLVVATTSPLLQKWFGSTGHPAAKDPYFLSIASNVGSMLALLAYPALVEPNLGLRAQAWVWTVGYMVLALGVAGCAYMVLKAPPSVQLAGAGLPEGSTAEMPVPPPPLEQPAPAAPAAATPQPETAIKPAAPTPAAAPQRGAIRRGSKQRGKAQRSLAAKVPSTATTASTPTTPSSRHLPSIALPPRPYEMTNWRRLRWVMLAAIPSSLMLGITTYMSTDISAIPLFWVIPLALYLLSFILVFMRWPVQWTTGPHTIMLVLQPFCLVCLTWILLTHSVSPIWRSVTFCLLAFFSTALVCHGEMARDRPPTRYLTEFYLWMSVGGMLGGMFNALFAPVMFTWLMELPLAVVFAALLRPKMPGGGWADTFIGSMLPELAEWFNKVGDDLYAQFNQPPQSATPGAEAAPAPQVHAPRGWFMGLTFDFVMPFLVVAIAAFLIWNAAGNWHWQKGTKDNPLFMFFWKNMGYKPNDAYPAAVNTSYVIMFGVPLILSLLMLSRPLRFGLALGGILFVTYWQEGTAEQRRTLAAERSYFGVLRVLTKVEDVGKYEFETTYLMHGTTHHGLNFRPDAAIWVFDADGKNVFAKDGKKEMRPLGRLATTYYHRLGPVGVIMEKLNWFNGQYGMVKKNAEGKVEKDDKGNPKIEYRVNYLGTFNDYSSDARLPVSVVGGLTGDLMGGLMGGLLPLTPVLAAWSEPPYATIGLGTGTMASYGRPYQHVVYYEIDEQIRSFSLRQDPYFNYVQDAINRGVKLEIVMGDARLSMKEERLQPDTTYTRSPDANKLFVVSTSEPKREHYYRAIIVDAFSSDAIPVHLITKEAITMYMSKLIKHRDPGTNGKDDPGCHGGILCVHTSNRHVDLVKPVTDVARSLKLKWRVGKDQGGRDLPRGENLTPKELLHIGHFGQEYVMLAESAADLPPDSPRGEQDPINPFLTWFTPQAPGNPVWTDDYSNLMSMFHWGLFRGE